MGRSGNKPGYKVFSISTTIRNPKRNIEFLEVLKKYDGKILNKKTKLEIYSDFVKQGIYKLTNIPDSIKDKYKNNIELSSNEIFEAISNNPQKTGDEGRVMTQIRALKDSGFIKLDGPRNEKRLSLTKLANYLIEGYNTEDVYTRSMIGLHAHNPQRTAMHNESRPFLNTLFVVKEINDYYGNQKGILEHEFGAFVLSMKNCDYKTIADKIIEYRNIYGNKINKEYIENFIYNELQEIETNFANIVREYTDDIYRKFDMTGLMSSSGFGENKYIRFNEYNIEKVNSILEVFKDYSYINFANVDDYVEYLEQVNLPWETSDKVKLTIINYQKELLDVEVDENLSLDNQIEYLDSLYNKRIFDTMLIEFELDEIKKELLLLGKSSDKSKYDDIPEPVRLEWLISLLMAKKYGSRYIKPNLILDDNGIPKSFASGGQADIEFISQNMHCLIEVTLMKDYKQQTNSETTSVSDHLRQLNTEKEKLAILIAPRIHNRVAEFFRFTTLNDQLMILALTIEYYIDLLEGENDIDNFIKIMKTQNDKMCNDFNLYCDQINKFKIA